MFELLLAFFVSIVLASIVFWLIKKAVRCALLIIKCFLGILFWPVKALFVALFGWMF